MKHRKQSSASKPRRISPVFWLGLLAIVIEVAVVLRLNQSPLLEAPGLLDLSGPSARAGDVVGQSQVKRYTAAEAAAVIHQNYAAGVPGPGVGVTKITFQYRSKLPTNEIITVYGRAYLPDAPSEHLPVFAFAPGTTGIGDECAAS